MKSSAYILVFITLLGIPYTESSMSVAALEQTKTMVKNSCIRRTGVEKQLLTRVSKGEFPKDRSLMCYIECCATTFQVLKNLNVNERFIRQQIQYMAPKDMKPGFLKLLEACKHIKSDDSCEMAWELAKCTHEVDPDVKLIPT